MQRKTHDKVKAIVLRLLLFFSLIGMAPALQSQVNVLVGYGFSIMQSSANNQILEAYYKENDWLGTSPAKLHMMHGLQLGMRHTWSWVSLGLYWQNQLSKVTMEGVSPVIQGSYRRDLYYSINSAVCYLETGSRFLSLGAALDYSSLNIKQRFTGLDNKISVLTEGLFGNQYYVSFNFPTGSNAQVSLKLSYYKAWEAFDLKPLASNLLISSSQVENKDFLTHFGVSLIIYNGPQYR